MSSRYSDGRPGIVSRARVVERIAQAATRSVVLVLAPAGYGKSVALDQYLTPLKDYARFDATRDGAGLLERIAESLEESKGTIVVDGLDAFEERVLQPFVALVERTKRRTRWILASRSSLGLPIGTWLAYGDCDLPIDRADLSFTLAETSDGAQAIGLEPANGELRALLEFTESWPVAVHLGLQAYARMPDRRDAFAAIREAAHHYWAEQVYASIDVPERALLAVAAALPDIDVGVLELAGFKTASKITDSFRARTGLLEETGSGAYRCPALFAEFLRHRTALLPANEREAVHLRAARALEAAGNLEHALRSYVTAKSQSDALRLLEVHGFDLLERGQSEAVSQAIDALDDATRRNRPRILALRGVLQSLDGNPVRAETLLRRSLSRAKDDRDLVGFASLRLAPLIANDGGDVAEILNPVADDPLQSVSVRAESLSLLATTRAIAGAKSAATKAALAVERLLIDIDLDSTRARVLQRVGVAAMYSGDNERSKQTLIQAADLATELGLHSVASRSWSALSNLMCHAYDDVMSQLWYAERAAGAARRSGNSLELQTALLQVAAAEMRRGNAEESAAIEEQLVGIRSDPRRAQLLVAFKALRLSWEGHFDEAHRELATSWGRMHHDFDRLICGAQCALFLALDGRRKSSISLISEVASLAEAIRPDGLFRVRYVALALLFCVVAEVVNERATNASRLVRRIGIDNADPVVYLAARTAEEFILPSRGVRRSPEISVALERLSALGYADVARVLQAVCGALDAKTVNADLTRSELAVLRLLGEGLTTKEIAVRHGRSTNTIRAHIANALGKLGCHRRVQAVAVARKLEIIS